MKKTQTSGAALCLALLMAGCGATGAVSSGAAASSVPAGSASAPVAESQSQTSTAPASTKEGEKKEPAKTEAEPMMVDTGEYTFELPAGLVEQTEMSQPEAQPAIYFFTSEEAKIEDMPSNIVVEIHPATSFEDQKAEMGEEKTQESFLAYIEATVLENLSTPAKNVEFSAIEEADRYLYVVEYDRETEQGVVHQTVFYAMGFDTPIVFYLTENGDSPQADLWEAARYGAATFQIK